MSVIDPKRWQQVNDALEAPLPEFPELAWRGVFADYRELMAEDAKEPGTPISETPLPFHFAHFLIICAAELGDTVKLDEGAPTFANLIVFCCGRTGTKKSTAGNLAREYVTRLFPEPAQFVTLASVSSSEGLIRTLMEKPNVLLRYDEIKNLFVMATRQGNAVESTLNSAFNLEPLETNVRKAENSLHAEDYYLNIIMNGTPVHVLLDLSETFLTGGLLNRFLVFAAKPTDVIKPVMGTPNADKASALANRLYQQCKRWRDMAPKRGSLRIGLTPEAKLLHAEWYTKHTQFMKNATDSEADPLTRLDTYVKRVAMIYALTENAPSAHPMITGAQMEAALAVVQYSEASMNWMIEAWIGQRPLNKQSEKLVEDRIETILKRGGCMREREICRRLHLSIMECKKAVDALVMEGILTVSGGPRTVHVATECLCDVANDD